MTTVLSISGMAIGFICLLAGALCIYAAFLIHSSKLLIIGMGLCALGLPTALISFFKFATHYLAALNKYVYLTGYKP